MWIWAVLRIKPLARFLRSSHNFKPKPEGLGINKVCSALDPDKGTELELTVYTLTVHDGGVNQGLCAESKMYIDDLRVKGGVILGRGWEVHVFFVSAQRCGCAVAPPGAAFCPGCMLFL